MKYNNKLKRAAALIALIALMTTPVSAVSTSLNLDNSSSINTRSNASNSDNVESLNIGIESNSSAGVNGETDSSDNSNRSRSQSSISGEAYSSSVIFTDENVRTDIEGDTSTALTIDLDGVRDDETFSLFARAMVQNDANIEKVDVTMDETSVWYKEEVRLFGIIPVTISTQARIANDGEVTIRYPWYKFLTDARKENIEGDLSARTQAVLSQERVTVMSELSANGRAEILSEIRDALREADDVRIESSSSTNVESTTQLDSR